MDRAICKLGGKDDTCSIRNYQCNLSGMATARGLFTAVLPLSMIIVVVLAVEYLMFEVTRLMVVGTGMVSVDGGTLH